MTKYQIEKLSLDDRNEVAIWTPVTDSRVEGFDGRVGIDGVFDSEYLACQAALFWACVNEKLYRVVLIEE